MEIDILMAVGGKHFIIDAGMKHKVKGRSWSVNSIRYVESGHRKGPNERFLHRYIMNPPEGMVIDHVNGDPTDNRMANLRVVTPSENARRWHSNRGNTSGVHGATWVKSKGCWQVQIRVCGNKNPKFVGLYKTLDEALDGRAAAELRHWGAYSPLTERALNGRVEPVGLPEKRSGGSAEAGGWP